MKSNLSTSFSLTPLTHFTCVVLAGFGVVLPALGADPSRSNPLDCVLEPYEVVEVSSAVQGVINRIHVSRNDMVGKGQLLVELDSEVERTQVELARARATLKTDIELRETELAFHERNQQRLEKLYQTDTVSLHIKDEAETDTEKSRLQLRSARDNKRLAELELAEAEAMLALRSMRSPISGVVVARNKVAGEYVEDQSILRLAQLDPLKVEVIAPVELFGSITEGMRVEVVPEYLGQEAVFATVTMVDRVIDPASGTFDVRAELPNPDLAIPSGLRCTVQFLNEPYPGAAIAATSEPEPEPQSGAQSRLQTQSPPQPGPEQAAGQKVANAADAVQEPAAPAGTAVDFVAESAVSLPTPATPESGEALCATAPPEQTTLYSVMVDPANNSMAPAEMLEHLRDEGVQDLFVLPRSGSPGKVSLGIYSVLAYAEKRQADIAGLGFQVTLEPQALKKADPQCDTEEQVAARGM
jgi:RND family efflux transporter MFP subunit